MAGWAVWAVRSGDFDGEAQAAAARKESGITAQRHRRTQAAVVLYNSIRLIGRSEAILRGLANTHRLYEAVVAGSNDFTIVEAFELCESVMEKQFLFPYGTIAMLADENVGDAFAF